MKVLIADDDRVLTHLLAAGLRSKGWHVEVTHDALQVLMSAMRSPPDVIVLDIAMPGGTGFGALAKLKRSFRTESVPVVVVSNSISPEDEKKVLGLGAVAFLRKPVDAETLDATLLRVLGKPSAGLHAE